MHFSLIIFLPDQHRCKVRSIFRVCRPGEEDVLRSSGIDNHFLLFHGSSTHNLISILARGLLVAPIGADTTGYMFGKVLEFFQS